jgi:HTH-type transcriptional regulator / antitoxin HipB
MDPQLILTRLGRSLRAARLARGLTQATVAERAGLSRRKVGEIERGLATVTAGAYARVTAALDQQLKLEPARRPTLDELQELDRE